MPGKPPIAPIPGKPAIGFACVGAGFAGDEDTVPEVAPCVAAPPSAVVDFDFTKWTVTPSSILYDSSVCSSFRIRPNYVRVAWFTFENKALLLWA